MSSRARRLPAGVVVRAFDWHGTRTASVEAPAPPPPLPADVTTDPGPDDAGTLAYHRPAVDAAAIEREAFSQGYAQGERAGLEAAAARSELVLRRLSGTIQELQELKTDILQRTEQQVVQLSLAIARRIVHREASLDRELVATMARVALDRLGRSATATIRLHPDDLAAVTHGRTDIDQDGVAQFVADPMVRRGGCLVQSDLGLVDVSLDAQIDEIGTALLGDRPAALAPAEAAGDC